MSYKYLLDANVIATSAVRKHLNTDFFRSNCVVLEEITYELLDTSLYEEVRKLAVPIRGAVLPYLLIVVDDMVGLGLIKTDEGNGEALIVAWGLMLLDGSSTQSLLEFMKDHPVIVTNETEVMRFAKTKGLDCISGIDFVKLLDSV